MVAYCVALAGCAERMYYLPSLPGRGQLFRVPAMVCMHSLMLAAPSASGDSRFMCVLLCT